MEVRAEILNLTKYNRKEDNSPRTMFTYRLLDSKSLQTKSDKFKGYACLTAYFDGHDVYDKIPANYCGCEVTLTIEKSVSDYDPTKEKSSVVKVNDISLV